MSPPAVLVLPGWGCGPELLAPILPPGVECVALVNWDTAWNSDDLVHLALRGVARLEGELLVLAWSLGAMIALEILPELTGRISALHLVAPCLRFTAGWPERVLARMRRRCAEHPDSVLADFYRRLVAPGEEAYTPAPSRSQPTAGLLAGLDYLATRDLPRPSALPGCQVYVLHGGADPVIPPELSRPVAEALGAKRLVLSGAGHAPQLSRTAECNAFLHGEGVHGDR